MFGLWRCICQLWRCSWCSCSIPGNMVWMMTFIIFWMMTFRGSGWVSQLEMSPWRSSSFALVFKPISRTTSRCGNSWDSHETLGSSGIIYVYVYVPCPVAPPQWYGPLLPDLESFISMVFTAFWMQNLNISMVFAPVWMENLIFPWYSQYFHSNSLDPKLFIPTSHIHRVEGGTMTNGGRGVPESGTYIYIYYSILCSIYNMYIYNIYNI